MKRASGWLCAACFLLTTGVCGARTTRETTYSYERIWSTAVRFLRVDNGYKVTEMDKETGYVLFEYPEAGRVLNGSMELIPLEQDGAEIVTLGLRIQDMPTYVENVLMDKLVRKLRDEYGTAPPRRRKVTTGPSGNSKESTPDNVQAEPESENPNADDIDNNDSQP